MTLGKNSDRGISNQRSDVLMKYVLIGIASLTVLEILRCSLCLLGWEQQAPRVLRITSALVLLPLAVGSVLLFLRGDGNGTLLIVGGYLLLLLFFSDKNEKTS